jgi:membrane protein required for colicin V production
MNILDLLILIPILYFCYRGVRNGFVGEILGIIGIILAVFLTFRFMNPLADLIASFIHKNPDYLPFLAGAVIFICTLIVLQIVALLLKSILKFVRLNTINSILGFFVGLFKGGIIISVLLILLAGFHEPPKRLRKNSVSYSYIIYLAPWAYNTISGTKFSRTIQRAFKKFKPVKNFPLKI